ncbi:MAG: hypothetical protein FJW32_09285 [Acidobacteria bacterium]|nr:hypothetical protein [Acidobacteriota bacterium]
MPSRAETLRTMLDQDPKNSFVRYALAMDHVTGGDLEGAVAEFRILLANDANYCAGYFHGGQSLEKLGRIDEAASLYRDGIDATRRTGDAHTRSELEAALSMIA